MDKLVFIKELEKKRERFELLLEQHKTLSVKSIFGNENEVRLEIGSGRGEFLAAMAQRMPQVNFIGVDIKEKRIRVMLRKLDFDEHKNVRVCRLFVDENVTKFIPENTFSKIYIIHPDPWPKCRHFQRRIIQMEFLDAVHLLLKEDGELLISTDHSEYAEWIRMMFTCRDDYVSLHPEGYSMVAPNEHVETHFEKKKKEEGFPPIFMGYKKVNK